MAPDKEGSMIDIGIVIFIGVMLINLIGLFVDLVLIYTKTPTITDLVHKIPMMGLPIIMFQLLGVLGLAYHFWNGIMVK